MKQMYGLILMLGLGATESAWAGLTYPAQIENRANQTISIYFYEKINSYPYTKNNTGRYASSNATISINDKQTQTIRIGSTDVIMGDVSVGGNVVLTINFIAPWKKYYINQNTKTGKYDWSHDNARAALSEGKAFNQ